MCTFPPSFFVASNRDLPTLVLCPWEWLLDIEMHRTFRDLNVEVAKVDGGLGCQPWLTRTVTWRELLVHSLFHVYLLFPVLRSGLAHTAIVLSCHSHGDSQPPYCIVPHQKFIIQLDTSSGGSRNSKNRGVKGVLAHVLQSVSLYKRGWKKLFVSAARSAHTQVRQCLPEVTAFSPSSPSSPNTHILFFPSGGNLWLHQGQGRWALISGRCHHLRHQEKWWWLVWGGHEWSDGAVPRELCGVDHALFRVKTRGQNSAFPAAGTVRASQISTSLWGPIQYNWMKDNCNNHSFGFGLVFFFFFPLMIRQ